MATDWIARAMAANGGGGGGGKGIDRITINDKGHLIIYFSDGTSSDVGKVTGKTGTTFQPSIFTDPEGRRVLHWEIVEEPGEVPEDIVLRMERSEWTGVDPALGDKYSEIEWGNLEADEANKLTPNKTKVEETNSNPNDYMWDTI